MRIEGGLSYPGYRRLDFAKIWNKTMPDARLSNIFAHKTSLTHHSCYPQLTLARALSPPSVILICNNFRDQRDLNSIKELAMLNLLLATTALTANNCRPVEPVDTLNTTEYLRASWYVSEMRSLRWKNKEKKRVLQIFIGEQTTCL